MHGGLNRFLRRAGRKGALAAAAAGIAMAPMAAAAQSAGLGAAGEIVDQEVLRVCADPSNMPFSDESGEGFENKLAELLAEKLGRKSVAYTWFPMATGFVRRTLGELRCDVIMGYAQGDELVQNTNAYYRSAYALVYKKGSDLEGVETIGDPKLKGKKIGVVAGTPPAANMAEAGLLRTAAPYHLMVDTRLVESVGEAMVKDILAGKIDAGMLWGPLAGYYAHQAGDDLAVVPLLKEKNGSRMAFRITMGVRPSDQEWKRELNKFIKENQEEINKILLEYHIPIIDEHDNIITQ